MGMGEKNETAANSAFSEDNLQSESNTPEMAITETESIDTTLDDDQFFIDKTPENVPQLTLNHVIIIVSQFEIAFDLWLFKRSKSDSSYYFAGVYMTGVLNFMQKNGYYKRYRADRTYIIIRDDHNIIEQVEIQQIRDVVTAYVRSTKKLSFDYRGETIEVEPAKLLETYLKTSHLIFNEAALGHLQNHEKPILRDTKEAMFFPFSNCVVKVIKNSITTISYTELNEVCVWREHIIIRSFELSEDYNSSHFARFINNVANGQDDRFRAFLSAIGYLLHNYTLQSKGQAVIAYDEEITDSRKPEGGTGKGVFAKALRQLRNAVTIDGKRFDKDDRFCFQNVNDTTQLVYFEDVKPDFDFMRLNSVLTEGWQIEVKNKPTFRIEAADSPKTYITSNSILKGEGTTIERRQFIIEFSPFYSKLARQKLDPIVQTHGCMFFDQDDWDQQEWNKFYSFMLYCGCFYLQNGLQYYELRSVADNKVRQNTSEDFSEWVDGQSFVPSVEYNMTERFQEFKNQFYGDDAWFTQRKFNSWLKTYAVSKKCALKSRRSNSINYGTFTPAE
jgi:hypothetical protein